MIDQSRQIGANYVTYLLGSYQLGRFLSSTKVYHEADAASRDDFVFAQLVHDGDWDPDPSAVHNLLKHVRDNSTLTIKFKKVSVQPRDPKATGYPLLYMTGHHEFHWTDQERRGCSVTSRPAGCCWPTPAAGGWPSTSRSSARSPGSYPSTSSRRSRWITRSTTRITTSARSSTRPA